MLGTVTISRYIDQDGNDRFETVSTDTTGEPLALVTALGMLEMARIELTSVALGLEYEDEEDPE